MRHRGRTIGLCEDTRTARARAAFRQFCGTAAEDVRANRIAALPQKKWRGVPVYLIRCEGPYGRGPHAQFVPEGVLWALISLDHYLCAYHR